MVGDEDGTADLVGEGDREGDEGDGDRVGKEDRDGCDEGNCD